MYYTYQLALHLPRSFGEPSSLHANSQQVPAGLAQLLLHTLLLRNCSCTCCSCARFLCNMIFSSFCYWCSLHTSSLAHLILKKMCPPEGLPF